MHLKLLVFYSFIGASLCFRKSYEKFKVYSVYFKALSEVENVLYWQHNPLIDFWSQPGINKTNNILVDPSVQMEFERFLSNEKFNYEILIENVGK